MSKEIKLLDFLKKNIDDSDDGDSENFREIADTLLSLIDYAYDTFKISDMKNKEDILLYYKSKEVSKFPEVLKEILDYNTNFYYSEKDRLNSIQAMQDDEEEDEL